MKCKLKVLVKSNDGELSVHPELSEILANYEENDDKKIFPMLAIDLGIFRQGLAGKAYFLEIFPDPDCIWYKTDENNKITGLDTSTLTEINDVPEKLNDKIKILEIEFETTCVLIDSSDEYLDYDKYDYSSNKIIDLDQWGEDLSTAIKKYKISLSYIGFIGGFPDFVQGKEMAGGTFIGQINTFDLNGTDLHIYLFYNNESREITHYIQYT